MTTVSETSNARSDGKGPSTPAVALPESTRERCRRLESKYASIAPPKVRGRQREARRWLDVLGVLCTNGRVCERRPGAEYLTPNEGAKIHAACCALLRATDPELSKAVHRIMWEQGLEDLGITLEDWKVKAARNVRRLAKIRAEMQRAGYI
jgi:hypothetical protein